MKTIILALLFVVALVYSLPQQPVHGAVPGGMFCDICKDLVDGAENMGLDDAKKYLEKEIGKFCDKLGFLSSLCQDALDGVIDDLAKGISQGLGGEEVCKLVHLC